MDSPLVVNNLSKSYGAERGIENVSFELKVGEVFGFLGPNGAGKSTTIRLIMGFLRADAGSISIFGINHTVGSTLAHNDIGYLAGDIALYPNLTGRATLNYLSKLGQPISWKYVNRLAKRFEAELDRPIRSLSKGNRQKIGLIVALMRQPKLLILDEPTSGLDPLMKQSFYDLLSDLKQAGTTVFMSSHDLAEVQKTCDRAGFIKDGQLTNIEVISSADHLKAHHFMIDFPSGFNRARFARLKGVKLVASTAKSAEFFVTGNIAQFLATVAAEKPDNLTEKQLDLEEIFMHYYTDEVKHEA